MENSKPISFQSDNNAERDYIPETYSVKDIDTSFYTSLQSVSESSSQESVRRLFYHFDKVVVQQLAWVDSADNLWRNAIIPLAMACPFLLYSALALAAGDIAVKFPMDSFDTMNNLSLSRRYRDKAMELLANQLKSKIHTAGETSSEEFRNSTNCMLAAIMLLCNLEMMLPGSSQWRLHLWGARTTIRRLGNTSHLPMPQDAVGMFLIQAFYETNVCAFMTTFSDIEHMRTDTLMSDGNSIFTEYFRILQSITETERIGRRKNYSTPYTSPEEFIALRRSLLQARYKTLALGQELQFWSARLRQEFEHVVDLYHNMALIYGYRILFGDYKVNVEVTIFKKQIFWHLQALEGNTAFHQDLMWPIFIAGTESRGSPEEQLFIEAKMLEVIRLTGPLDRRRALKFLKEYWELAHDLEGGWIEFARKWATVGKTFLVF